MTIADVDCTENKDLCLEHGVSKQHNQIFFYYKWVDIVYFGPVKIFQVFETCTAYAPLIEIHVL